MMRLTMKLLSLNVPRSIHLSPLMRYCFTRPRKKEKLILRETNLKMIQEAFLKQNSDWKQLRQELCQENNAISDINVDGVVLGVTTNPQYLDGMKSYIKFLDSEGIGVNYACMMKLLRCFYYKGVDQGLSEQEEEEVYQWIDRLRNKAPAVNFSIGEAIILAFSVTKKWKEAVQMLNELNENSINPQRMSYSVIAAAGFRNNEPKFGVNILKEGLNRNTHPNSLVFQSWIEYCCQQKQWKRKLEQMFSFIEENRIKIVTDVVETLQNNPKLSKSTFKNTRISPKGRCGSCNQFLRPNRIFLDEFNLLQSEFLNKVFIKKDVFLNTNPTELKNFEEFLEQKSPYDCVIDGLNVAYSRGADTPTKIRTQIILSVVNYFAGRDMRTLVLGRKHMSTWPRWNEVKRSSSVFLAEDQSKDDPFLLYATLKSGSNACFCSRDLMKMHSQVLGAQLKPLFLRWQQQHQYLVSVAERSNKIFVKPPLDFDQCVQKSNDYWHIPHSLDEPASLGYREEIQIKWLCLKL